MNSLSRAAQVLLLTLVAASVFAQQIPPKVPRISQGAIVSQVIGVSEVTITYHRPGVKGRQIWGGLVPYHAVWRAGANEATTISFTDDVTIDEHPLAAGTYSFFTIPGEDEWKVIFNSDANQWGAFHYDSSKNVLVLTVSPQSAPTEEWLTYGFTDLTPTSASAYLRWEKLQISFTIVVNTSERLASSAKSSVTSTTQLLSGYAHYCLDNKTNLPEGLEAAEKAAALNETYPALRLKAELLAALGRNEDAVKVGERAISVGKTNDPKLDVMALEKEMKEWKEKR